MKKEYEKLNHCPVCLSESFKKLTSGFGDHKELHKFLKLDFFHSNWDHCNSCDHLFLNPVFSETINSDFYDKKSTYRTFSMGEKSLEQYLNTIDPNIPQVKKKTGDRREFLKKIRLHLQENDKKEIKVLDFGAGFGTSQAYLSMDDVSYLGVEIDTWCLKVAKNYGRNVVEPSKVIVKEFDIVFSWQVFEHIKDPQDGISQAISYLKPGGLIGINIPTHKFSKKDNWSFAGLRCLNWTHFHSYTENSMRKLFMNNNIDFIKFYLKDGDICCIGRKRKSIDEIIKEIAQPNRVNFSTDKEKLLLFLHIFLANILRPIIFIKRLLRKIIL
mgnify:CR=1 FL=1